MPRLLRILLCLIVAVLLLAGGTALWAYNHFHAPGPLIAGKTIIIPKSAGLNHIAMLLHKEGVVSRPRLLMLGAKLTKVHRSLQAGEYSIPAAVSPAGALQILHSGKTVRRYLTIPEGLTFFQVLEILNKKEGLTGAVSRKTQDGYLFPATYDFSYGDERQKLIDRMEAESVSVVDRLWQNRNQISILKSKHELLVLASIVEKETGVAAERARIAAVFLNRLRRGMRLQSDPTVVYAITQGQGPLGRALTRADLKIDNPYNTYRFGGLPPAPICNPGQAALEAVLNPAKSEELYFVADGTGGHAFAKTLREHNRNVAKWRKLKNAN